MTGGAYNLKQLQQLLSQPLPLQQLEVHGSCSSRWTVPSLAHLTRLTKLTIEGSVHQGAALPAQLQSLHLDAHVDLAHVLALKQLQHLTLCADSVDQHHVLQLAKLPGLQELALYYHCGDAAAAAAPTWVLLPQLRRVDIDTRDYGELNSQQSAAVLPGVAAATQLTRLFVHGPAPLREHETLAWCGELAGIKGLRHLGVDAACLVPGDALALTQLTQLTFLGLWGIKGLSEVEVTAFARCMKHLKELAVPWSDTDFGSATLLAAVGQMRQLTYLEVDGHKSLTQQGLMQLTGLSALQQLIVDTNDEITSEVLERFWAAVQQQ